MNNQRLFFALQVEAPWPLEPPEGRILDQEVRHLTLAFLGTGHFPDLLNQVETIPRPPFRIAPVGTADSLICLPPESPRVIATTVCWCNGFNQVVQWQEEIKQWLLELGYTLDKRPFFPHITFARAPFDPRIWKEAFYPLPFFTPTLHLYESLGNLHYKSVWSYPLIPPFEEFEHTADIAFLIRGASLKEIHLHAQIALSFKHPSLIPYFAKELADSLDEIIIDLNRMIGESDREEGSPFKAVSFHGLIQQTPENILTWEMIVDV